MTVLLVPKSTPTASGCMGFTGKNGPRKVQALPAQVNPERFHTELTEGTEIRREKKFSTGDTGSTGFGTERLLPPVIPVSPVEIFRFFSLPSVISV